MRRVIVTMFAIAAACPGMLAAQAPGRDVWSSAMTAPASPPSSGARSSTARSSAEAAEWTSLAHEQYAAKRYRESIASFERALQLGTDRPDVAALHIAHAYARLDNQKQARRWLEIRALGRCAASLGGRAGSLRERPLAVGAQGRA